MRRDLRNKARQEAEKRDAERKRARNGGNAAGAKQKAKGNGKKKSGN